MSSPAQEFFFPLTLDQLARTSNKEHTVRAGVIGEGELYSRGKSSAKRFVILRMSVGDGTYGRFPVIVPKDVQFADAVFIKNDGKSGPRIFMHATQPKEGVCIRLVLDRKKLFERRWCSRLEYAKIDGSWVAIAADGEAL